MWRFMSRLGADATRCAAGAGAELSVRVTVAPEGGKANAAACMVVAKALGVAKSSVRVVRGDTARHKILRIEGVDDAAVRQAFGEPDAPLF